MRVTDTKSPLDQAVDLLVYAPIGLAVAARDLVPTLVERGRRQVDPQVVVARMVGQMAVNQGRTQAEKAVERTMAQARATLQRLGILPDEAQSSGRPGPEQPSSTTTRTAAPPATGHVVPPRAPIVVPPAVVVPPTVVVPPAARTTSRSAAGEGASSSLAIPDYDSLSASQVVPRLSSLSAEELESVRAYEDEHRGRKTILNRIAQIRVP